MSKSRKQVEDKINWSKVSSDKKIIELIKQRNKLESAILLIDRESLIRYELEYLSLV